MDEKFLNKIVELQNLFDEGVVTTADNIPQPEPRQDVVDREAINRFMRDNPPGMADGGMLVKPSADGSRPGYKTKKGYIKPLSPELQKLFNQTNPGEKWGEGRFDATKEGQSNRANWRYTIDEKKKFLDDLIKIIENKDRSLAGFSVPAKGLFLTEIEYPKNIYL